MAKKKYDPLWETIDEKIALQGAEPELIGHCPHCHVTLRLSPAVKVGERYECGLCGGLSEVAEANERVSLKPLDR